MMEDQSAAAAERRQSDPRPGHGAGPFVDAVVAQLSRGVDEAGAGAQQQVDSLADRLASVLIACEQRDPEPALTLLVEDPVLLSAVFQNIDLLYAHEYPYADAVSLLTLDAVHRAVEAEEE
jgi:hypothetical protein